MIQRAEFGWPGGDRPGALVFRHDPAPEVRAAILACVLPVVEQATPPAPPQSPELHALTPPDGAIGRYRLAVANRSWFVRVSARVGHAALEQSITGWLRDHGVAVNHLQVAGLSLTFNGDTLRADLRELLDARHFENTDADLRSLTTEIARCHAALRTFPQAAEVKANAAARFTHLAKVRDQIAAAVAAENYGYLCQDADWARDHAEWFREMTRRYEPRLDLRPDAQTLHAQIHRANVLYRPDDHPVLLDFEEAVQTYAPVAWDMAYFVQRFCLAQPAEHLPERLAIIRAAYAAPVPGLSEMMQQTAWFSMAILVDYRQRGIASPLSEYEKFVHLERQAHELADKIDAAFA